jgi:hypothetical protein
MSGWYDPDDETPDLATEEGRDEWIDIMLQQDDWAQCQVIHDGENMIARFRWDDGREEIFDMQIRRLIEIVRPVGEESN